MNQPQRWRRLGAGPVLALVLASSAAAEPLRSFDLPPGPLPASIAAVARLAGIDVAAPAEVIDGRPAPRVTGRLSPQAALERLIAGQGLELVRTGTASFAVRVPPEPAPAPAPAAPGNDDEIVVTGTRIRGTAPVGAPLTTITAEAIANTGYATTAQLLASLPQNFKGGAGEDTRTGAAATGNISGGTAINLRGLGADATLVLVNGRRSPQGGGNSGGFVDVSAIPLSAIERVEVLPDGASAVYGADAVAGVVNFVLKRNFTGIEARLRGGTSTRSGVGELGGSLTAGARVGALSLLGVYDYWRRDELAASERRFAASTDLRPLGGSDFRINGGNPGNIVSPRLAGLPAGQDGRALTPGGLLVGQANRANLNEGRDLLPEQERHAGLLVARLDLGAAELFAEGRLNRRAFSRRAGGESRLSEIVPASHPFFVSPVAGSPFILVDYNLIDDLGPITAAGRVATRDLAAGIEADIWGDWRAAAFVQHAREETHVVTTNIASNPAIAEALGVPLAFGQPDRYPGFDPRTDGYFNPFGDGANSPENVTAFIRGFNDDRFAATGEAVNVKADGALFRLAGGDAKLALGAEARRERFTFAGVGTRNSPTPEPRTASAINERRHVEALFGEAYVPLVDTPNRRLGLERLALSAAVRAEHASDFGWSVNPRIGALWSPVEGLALRASYGTSFKAPRLADLSETQANSYIFDLAKAGGGTTRSLVLLGANPGLKPERARSFNFGFDAKPVAGLEASLTYFDVRYRDRIASAGNVNLFLLNPALYDAVITRDPDDAFVEGFIASPGFLRFGPVPPASTVEAVLDGRLFNLSSVRVRGIDARLGYRTGRLSGAIEGTYLIDDVQRLLPAAPERDVVGTLGNPIDLKLRASLGYDGEHLGMSAFLNYADSYRDPVSQPARRIGSLATVDLQLRYTLPPGLGLLGGTRLSASVINLFDNRPPFANNPVGLGYDPDNADPLGRVVALELTRRF